MFDDLCGCGEVELTRLLIYWDAQADPPIDPGESALAMCLTRW